MKNIFLPVIIISVFLASCTQKRIVDTGSINHFLENQDLYENKISKNLEEIDFWKKRLAKDTGSTVDKMQLGWLYAGLFSLTGKPAYLQTADSFFRICIRVDSDIDPDIYFSASQNAIAKHHFKDAYDFVKLADKKGADKYISSLIAFDVAMELGNYREAVHKLESLKDKGKFDYLIRKAKLEDHQGNLAGAITYMEKAFEKVKDLNKLSLYCWTLSNLSDMYGHAGKIKEAYRGYVDVLKKDSSYVYALKGIAHIAYSADRNTDEAKRIINYILSQTEMPDLYLALAEMEEYEGNKKGKDDYTRKFIDKVSEAGYGDMYNKYLIEIFAADPASAKTALELALKETVNRMTPETFSLLAWAYYKKGDIQQASELYRNFVFGKTFEPVSMLHGAYIMKAAGENEKAKKLFSECLSSSFELGPVISDEIKFELSSL